MASTVSSSCVSSSTLPESPRREAGPLPAKRGEIGFIAEVHIQAEVRRASTEVILPARHPADRDATTDANPNANNDSTSSGSSPAPPSGSIHNTPPTSSPGKKKGLCFWNQTNIPSFGGFLLTTLLALTVQVACATGTVVGWVLSTQKLARDRSSGGQGWNGASSIIFVHVVFGVALLGQILFIERRVFRLRAERYSYLHPGEILPSFRRGTSSEPSIGFSPWHRPPLPTYAAALAQSGVGTGDVEDHLIAAPPPPAYGNTRGSTLLLAGFLQNSPRADVPISPQTQPSQRNDRPISYVSQDDQWEEVQDAERARRLEETLTRLDRPASRS